MTLDRFFEKDTLKWTDSHVQKLREEWKKMGDHKLLSFNKEWYSKVFEDVADATLDYYVSLNIPYFSEWAADEKKSRDTVNFIGGKIL